MRYKSVFVHLLSFARVSAAKSVTNKTMKTLLE
jgi:hypothetical protein